MFARATGQMGLIGGTSPLGLVDNLPFYGHSRKGPTDKHTYEYIQVNPKREEASVAFILSLFN